MLRRFSVLSSLTVLALTVFLVSGCGSSEEKTLEIGVNNEPGNQIVVAIAQHVLEDELGYTVDAVRSANGVQWQAIAQGDMDAMLVAWLPTTQAAYWEKYKTRVTDIGVIYKGKIGLAIPDYIPEDVLDSIEDLKKPEVRKKLDAKITGIEPGAGIMMRTEKALEDYGLASYKLTNSSVAAMAAELSRADNNQGWIVVTGWSPLFIFAKWDLRYLKDPKQIFGVTQKVHALSRQGFREDAPRAAAFLADYSIPVDALNDAILDFQEGGELEETTDKFVAAHKDLIDDWIADAKNKSKFAD